jgi:hypothetical protein
MLAYLNIDVSTILTAPEFADNPAEVGIWLRVAAYAATLGTRGVIADAKKLSPRQFFTLVGIHKREVAKAPHLLTWENDDLFVRFYPADHEEKYEQKCDKAQPDKQLTKREKEAKRLREWRAAKRNETPGETLLKRNETPESVSVKRDETPAETLLKRDETPGETPESVSERFTETQNETYNNDNINKNIKGKSKNETPESVSKRFSETQNETPDETPSETLFPTGETLPASSGVATETHFRPPKDETSQNFKDFYALYPRKVSPQTAWKAWKEKKLNQYTSLVLEKLERYKNGEWVGRETKHIPYPATWLNSINLAFQNDGEAPPILPAKPTATRIAFDDIITRAEETKRRKAEYLAQQAAATAASEPAPSEPEALTQTPAPEPTSSVLPVHGEASPNDDPPY